MLLPVDIRKEKLIATLVQQVEKRKGTRILMALDLEGSGLSPDMRLLSFSLLQSSGSTGENFWEKNIPWFLCRIP